MGIARFKPDAPSPIKVNLPRIEPTGYKGIVETAENGPLHRLVAYVEGSPWTVTYYSQVLNQHNDLKEVDIEQQNPYQQYTKINQLELRVSGPLSAATDANTAITTVTGSALIYPFLTPNVADHFIADIRNGREGLFRVTQVERRSHNNQSVYSIEYDLLYFIDQAPEVYNNLESKVIHTYYFHKERLLNNLPPTILTNEHNALKHLTLGYYELVNYYCRNFFNREFSTFILPGQDSKIYDSFLVKFLLTILSTTDALEVKYIKNLNTEKDVFIQQSQLWSILIERNSNSLPHVNRRMGFLSTAYFNRDATLNSLRYTRLNYIIYPIMPDTTIESTLLMPFRNATDLDIIKAYSQSGHLGNLIKNQYIDTNISFPLITPVLDNETYLVSSEFYTDLTCSCLLEHLIKDYLLQNAINPLRVKALLDSYATWGRLEQFYYIPILILLIKATCMGLHV